MLIEISCNIFRDETIKFHSGLNVVLGDNVATNSIGKSTLLMVLDFIFGGESFLKENSGVIDELGDHDYYFKFEFNSSPSYFKRGTFKSDLVYICNQQYQEQEPISIDEYRNILKDSYNLNEVGLSFRSIVSLYSRIWGKENLDVKLPLHSFKGQSSSDCIDNTLKIYKKYGSIKLLAENVKRINNENSAINNAFKQNLITKSTKTQYKKNILELEKIKDDIQEIKSNLEQYSVNIKEVVNKEVLESKIKKDQLLYQQLNIESRLARVELDLKSNRHLKSKHLSPLLKFFPEVNLKRIGLVEEFHSNITKILRNELKESQRELTENLELINSEIDKIDQKIATILEHVDSPGLIVDRVYDLSKLYTLVTSEIEYFERDSSIKLSFKEAKEKLELEKLRVLKLVEDIINNKTRSYVNKIYSDNRRSPILTMHAKSYSFKAVEDTGTGKAYSNLILLDVSFLETTDLPFLIHDSVLFKNIQNEAVSRLVDLYESKGKQVFIAIDEIKKYGKETEKKLLDKKVIQLSNDHVLYTKDWRRK